MAQRPAHVKIGHLRYRVMWDKAEIDKRSVKAGFDGAGFSNGSEQIIIVDPDMASDYTAETLLHEVLHQCLNVAGVQPDNDAKAGVTDVEERAVSALAGVLLGALRSNSPLVEFLLDDGLERTAD